MSSRLMRTLRRSLRRFTERRALRRRFPTAEIDRTVVINGGSASIRLGANVTIMAGTFLHLGGRPWCENAGCLEIGDGSVISPHCVIYGCGPGGVRIGKRLDCGPGVGIFASRTDYRARDRRHHFAPVVIGDDVIIYANAVISPGVRIGDGAVIAACSVVTRDVPANALVAGSPAVVVEENVRARP